MKNVIVAGTRTFRDTLFIYEELASLLSEIGDFMVISGGATGPDTIALNFAWDYGLKSQVFRADWYKYRKAAGPIRNRQMAKNADMLIAFWDGVSRGTENMIEEATKRNLDVRVIRIENEY